VRPDTLALVRLVEVLAHKAEGRQAGTATPKPSTPVCALSILNAESFANLRQVQALGERPHSSLGHLTPSEFAAGRPTFRPGLRPSLQGRRHHQ
jgi:hypothetical protein